METQKIMKNIENYKKTLKRSYFFSALTDTQLYKITEKSKIISYKRSSIIFYEEDKADNFYLLAEGSIRIYKLSSKGKEQTLGYISEGEPFGEAAVFMNKNFLANAEAETDCNVIIIKRDDFIDIIKNNPDISLKLLGLLSERLKKFANLIESLSLKEVPEHLCQYLSDLYKKQKTLKLKLPVSKAHLAVHLGTTSETLSRALGKLSDQKIIRVDNKHITILNLSDLNKI